MVSVHARLGVAVILVAVIGAGLVLVARARPDALPTVRVFVRLCTAAAALEAVIGIVLLILGNRPSEGIHFFYGAATVVPVPLAGLLGRGARPGDETWYLLAGVAATALFGLRAVTTGAS